MQSGDIYQLNLIISNCFCENESAPSTLSPPLTHTHQSFGSQLLTQISKFVELDK